MSSSSDTKSDEESAERNRHTVLHPATFCKITPENEEKDTETDEVFLWGFPIRMIDDSELKKAQEQIRFGRWWNDSQVCNHSENGERSCCTRQSD